MFKHTNFTWILFLFLASTAPVYAEPCADFVFPTSDDFVLTEEENTTLLIPFTINHSTKTCLQGPFLIRFHKITDYSGLECSLTHKHGICQEPKMTKCLCPAETQKYYFNHTFRRDDNWPTEWLWSTDNDVIHQRNISFNVLYPAEITELSIGSSTPAERQSVVTVTCSYDEGNPLVTARLLDRHGVEMEGSIYSSGQIRYRFPAVSCQDAGLIRCEAPGASHNMTTILLVKCPSEIRLLELSKNETDTAYLKLGVRTHTDEIEDCKLEGIEAELSCSVTTVTGTPPDLILIVRLDNLKSSYEGHWRLTLTNDAGSGHLDFYLILNKDASSQNQTPVTPMIFGSAVPTVSSSGTLFGESSVWVVASAVIGIIVLLNVIVCIVCALKAKRGPTPSPPTPDTTMRERQSIPLEEMASGQSVHYYWEVSDVSSAPTSFSEGEFDDELPPPPPPCHDPGHPPDDYLKPVSSRDEREDTGADWKMVPFYGNTQLRDIRDADRTATGTSNMSYTESGATENNKAVDESSDNLAQIGKCGTEAEETEYVRYSPPLYENTYP